MMSVDRLVDALGGYRGGVLVVSHDFDFLNRLGVDTWYRMVQGGELEGVTPE